MWGCLRKSVKIPSQPEMSRTCVSIRISRSFSFRVQFSRSHFGSRVIERPLCGDSPHTLIVAAAESAFFLPPMGEPKFKRWAVYLAKTSLTELHQWKGALQTVIKNGYAPIILNDISEHKVELVWTKSVTVKSAVRLCKSATEHAPGFKLLQNPVGVACEELRGGGEKSEGDAKPEVEQKRVRLATKRPCAAYAAAASTLLFPPQCLALKCENMLRAAAEVREIPTHGYELRADLAQGNYGRVYHPGIARTGWGEQRVVIKLFGLDNGAQAVEAEVRRHGALFRPPNPHILRLIDIQLFPIGSSAAPASIGLIFEHQDTNLQLYLKRGPLKLAGMRHVCRSVLAALRHLHESGLVHTALRPVNIFMSGAAIRAAVRENEEALGEDVALEIVYQVPSSFEVRSTLKHVL